MARGAVTNLEAPAGRAEAMRTADAGERKAAETAESTSPDKSVVSGPPPRPGYPRFRVEAGEPIRLAEVDPDHSEHYEKKKDVRKELKALRDRIGDLQARLYAEHRRSLLIVLQAIDTGGKDGTIKGVFMGVNPQGCQVTSFKAPSVEESDHDFLWRYHERTPAKGMIAIFNRSHYEDVLIVRVKNLVPEQVWRQRFDTINEFEHMLTLNDITVLKFFLHISRDEQKRRLESRLADPSKRWKFSVGDLGERMLWDKYQLAFEEAINNCSTPHAPWYVVPANKNWYRNLIVARTIADTLEAMNPQYPAPDHALDDLMVPD